MSFTVGITRDTLRADGTSIFDQRALQMLDEAKLQWEFIPDNVKELTAAHGAEYDALCVLNPKVPAAVVSGPDKRIKIVARMGVGYDSVDVKACTENGVILTNTPDGVRRPVATSILALILALSHKLATKDALTRTGRWSETTNHMGVGLTGKTVGSIGVGNIGGELFRLLAPLDMVHIAYDPYAKAEDAATLRVRLTDKETVFREADVVCVNTPLTPETRGFIGAREFALMKPTAYFINTARGPIVDEKALYAALAGKRIAGAALDVFEVEPVGQDNPLLTLDNVIVTPHSICWTDEFFRNNAESAFRSVVAVATGKTPTFVVNRDVLQYKDVRARLLDRHS
ncbi:MAG TPA: hydroxyacid dehydrogenase [Vicinamibacterales bacterium]|jgi:D-3-phosphoglycerate dehydrogenase